MQSIKCELPKAELVAEIEDCLGDDCGGGSGLPWPISPAPPEDPSDPNPWEPIIPGGSCNPLIAGKSKMISNMSKNYTSH